MTDLHSFAELAKRLAAALPGTVVSLDAGMAACGHVIQRDAQERIGSYQGEVGPFPAWAPLTPGTQADRVAKGFAPEDPLLRTGELRDSIVMEHEHFAVVVGSTSPVAGYQEYGTSSIPPRPFIGPAALAKMGEVCRILGSRAVLGLSGGPALSIDYGALGKEDA